MHLQISSRAPGCWRCLLLAFALALASPAGAVEEAPAAEGERVEGAPDAEEGERVEADPDAEEGERVEGAPDAEEGERVEADPDAEEVERAEVAPVAEVEEADPEPGAGIEELTVTARKREEAIQDTPISITAFSEQGLLDRNIRDLTELTQFTPNLNFGSGAAQSANAQVYIRGIGQAEGTINAEPRVGLYLDDVYQARPLGSILDTFDLQRVEVLRGPQGTLYGKNAIGGAINIISNAPGPDYETRAELEFANDDPHVTRAHWMGNMPVDVLGLGDKLFLRGTFVWEEREGYLYDEYLNENFASHDLLGGSAKVRYLPIESLEVQANYSITSQPQKSKRGECVIDSKADEVSQANREFNETKEPTEAFRSDFLQAVDSDNFTERIGNFREACAASHGLTTSTNMPNRDKIGTQKIHGFITWETPELGALGPLTVKSITAYQKLDQDFNFDWDSMALTMLHSHIPDLEHEQFSQELRVHGDAWDGRFFWTLGGFYLDEESWGPRTTTVGVAPDVRIPIPGELVYQPIEGTIGELSDFRHRTAAGYLFGEIQPIDPLRINAGFRYGWEKKTISKSREIDICLYGGGDPPCFPLDPNPDTGFYELFDEYEIPSQTDATARDSWTAPTGNVSGTWDITSDAHLYAGYQHGFSSGGFNYIGDEPDQTPNAFDPEELDGIEVGLKTTWFDNRLTANASYFFNFYRDMQVRIWEAQTSGTRGQFVSPTTAIRNAGDATIQGAEFELVWMPVANLLLTGNLGLTFPQYDDFELLDPDATILATREQYPEGLPDGVDPVEVFVDYTDNNFPNTPKVNFNIGARYTWQITDDLHLSPWINYSWRSKVYFDVANTKELSEDAMGLLDASLTLDIFSTKTTITLWVKNTTDETYLTGGYNLGSYVSRYYGLPRTFGGTITQSFGGP